MSKLQRAAVLISLIKYMKARGSWCGETHVQKAVYFLVRLFDIPLGFRYIMYKHGPYSFDLSDEMNSMRADGFVALQPQTYPYGPMYELEDGSKLLSEKFSKTISKNDRYIEFISSRLGTKGVVELERFATALYVTHKNKDAGDVDQRAKKINALKPHVSIDAAAEAIREVDKIVEDAKLV